MSDISVDIDGSNKRTPLSRMEAR
nr:hypothetical protein BOSE7B_10026 [Bosea sp. 7B]